MKRNTPRSPEYWSVEKSFGQVLQQLRQERGLSQEELAFESGYHRTELRGFAPIWNIGIIGSREVLMQKKNSDYYVLIVFGDILPNLQGPFADEVRRDARARKLKARYGDKHGIFALDVDPDGLSTVNAY